MQDARKMKHQEISTSKELLDGTLEKRKDICVLKAQQKWMSQKDAPERSNQGVVANQVCRGMNGIYQTDGPRMHEDEATRKKYQKESP